ncbi:hypothetical protein D7Y56_00895 (plasmid) [Streptomyces sp. S501]|nr:hypothetical protein D7Y56_00895 [Streptomyces sp. S501]
MTRHIPTARAAHLAVRAVGMCGLAHPLAFALFAAAATAAARAWDAGHQVTDVHPARPRGTTPHGR